MCRVPCAHPQVHRRLARLPLAAPPPAARNRVAKARGGGVGEGSVTGACSGRAMVHVPWARSERSERLRDVCSWASLLGCTRAHTRLLPRRLESIGVVEAAWFDKLALVTILVNCGMMAWESPLDPKGTWKEHLIHVTELVPPAGSQEAVGRPGPLSYCSGRLDDCAKRSRLRSAWASSPWR